MKTKIIITIVLFLMGVQLIGQVNPTAAIKPGTAPNQMLITEDIYGADRLVYKNILFDISNDSLRFTSGIRVDLSGISGGGTVTGTGTTNYLSKWTGTTSQGNSLLFDNGTNVGIGTNTPGAKLDIENGTIRFTDFAGGGQKTLIIDNNGDVGTTTTGGISDWELSGTNLRNTNYSAGTDGVAINRSSAGAALDVEAIAGSGELAQFRNDAGNRMFRFQEAGNTARLDMYNSSDAIGFRLVAAGTSFLNGSNLAIGTTSASERLEVNGRVAAGIGFRVGLTGATQIGNLFNVGGTMGFQGAGSRSITLGSETNGELVRIDNNSEEVGIGTSTPNAKLHIVSNGSTTGKSFVAENSSGTDNFTILDNGKVGIGTAAPTALLEVSAIDGSDINISTFNDTGNDFAITDGTNLSNLQHRPTYLRLTSSPFQVVNNDDYQIITGTNQTNSATKDGGFATFHYTNAEEPFIWLKTQTSSAANSLRFGGGDSGGNAATVIDFHTAVNNTTTTGTRKMRITGDGTVEITELMNIDPRNTVPGSATSGDIYMDDGTNTGGTPTLRYYNGSAWVNM